ncbi:MAG: hypothetical protein HY744_30840 [Deltaproteobacteria bacterium]|nr:hypothetical protein [Deltaproteobacteria bacterium]
MDDELAPEVLRVRAKLGGEEGIVRRRCADGAAAKVDPVRERTHQDDGICGTNMHVHRPALLELPAPEMAAVRSKLGEKHVAARPLTDERPAAEVHGSTELSRQEHVALAVCGNAPGKLL